MRAFAGRQALVTGAANGIGRAIVERLVNEGAVVAAVDREPMSSPNARVVPFEFDLSRLEEIPQLVTEVEDSLGRVDVLVNCAAHNSEQPALALQLGPWRHVLAISLEAPVFLACAVARGMARRGYGRIVNITSVHGAYGAPGSIAYDVSKAGLNNATRTLATELAPYGVLVNAIAPGFVNTRMAEANAEWFQDIYVHHHRLPLQRQADPLEIAGHVAWVASEDNTYLTGQVITVDGGLTATF